MGQIKHERNNGKGKYERNNGKDKFQQVSLNQVGPNGKMARKVFNISKRRKVQ